MELNQGGGMNGAMIGGLLALLFLIVFMTVRGGKKKPISVFPKGPRTSPFIDIREGPGPAGSGVGAHVPKTPVIDSAGNTIPASPE